MGTRHDNSIVRRHPLRAVALAAMFIFLSTGVGPPGGLTSQPSGFNDNFRGWPLFPLHQQHPLRSSFLDPREPGRSREYHAGIDIGVRDDRPASGAPPGRAHRVFAIEGGIAFVPRDQATRRCVSRHVRIGHFEYAHVDTVSVVGHRTPVRAGQLIGWTCRGMWHVHLAERRKVGGQLTWVNPLRPGGKIRPYVDRVPPSIRVLAFYTPAFSGWSIGGDRFRSSQAGVEIPRTRLRGSVDVRAMIGDPQSFHGAYSALPRLQAELHPYRVAFELLRDGRRVMAREVFRADVYFAARVPQLGLPILFDFHFAPGTVQTLPAAECLARRSGSCRARLWFRLFGSSTSAFWDTTSLQDGAYTLRVHASDAAGNSSQRRVDIVIANRTGE